MSRCVIGHITVIKPIPNNNEFSAYKRNLRAAG